MNWPWSKSKPAEYQAPAKGIKGATLRLQADDGRFRHASEVTKEIDQHREFSDLYETTVAGSIINTEVDDLFAQGRPAS